LILLTGVPWAGDPLRGRAQLLGLGVNEPTPAWGLMLRGASVQFVQQAPWLAIAPGVALSWRVFASIYWATRWRNTSIHACGSDRHGCSDNLAGASTALYPTQTSFSERRVVVPM